LQVSYLIMEVRTIYKTCSSCISDKLSLFYKLACFYLYPAQMSVKCFKPVVMLNYYKLPIISLSPSILNYPVSCCINRGSDLCPEINTWMKIPITVNRMFPVPKSACYYCLPQWRAIWNILKKKVYL